MCVHIYMRKLGSDPEFGYILDAVHDDLFFKGCNLETDTEIASNLRQI